MSRRQLFGSLCAMIFMVNLGRVVFAPLLEPLRTAFGADTAALGLLATLVWVGSAAPRVPVGWALTRVPRHVVIFVAGTLLTAGSVLAAVAPTIRALQGAAVLVGLSSGAYFIAANPLVSELFPDRVGRALGVHGTASQFAAIGAPLFVTVVLDVGTWQTTFWVMAVAALASTAVFSLAAWWTDLPDAGTEDRDFLGAARAQWRIILAGAVMLGATTFVWQGVFNFYVTYLVGKGLSADTGRLLLSVMFGAGVPAFLVSGRLADDLPIVPYILGLSGGFLLLVFGLTLVTGVVALAACSVALGYVIHSFFPAVDTYLLGSLPDRHRASAYAVYSASMMTMQSGGSFVVGTLEATYTFTTIFRAFAVGLLVLLAALLVAYSQGRLPATARA